MKVVDGFAIQRSDLDGFRRIELIGELDLATAPQVSKELDGSSDGVNRLVLDTTQLAFIDSTGLHLLLEARQRFGAALELIPGKATERLLELAGLREYFGLE
ncbi:MAG TPA: STAS domain-containing protein [Acidimicrobiia bacterium]|nr:STAS domain-containing protein [Acidimicrobiia bacterium]